MPSRKPPFGFLIALVLVLPLVAFASEDSPQSAKHVLRISINGSTQWISRTAQPKRKLPRATT